MESESGRQLFALMNSLDADRLLTRTSILSRIKKMLSDRADACLEAADLCFGLCAPKIL